MLLLLRLKYFHIEVLLLFNISLAPNMLNNIK